MPFRAIQSECRKSAQIFKNLRTHTVLLLAAGLCTVILASMLAAQVPEPDQTPSSISRPFTDGERLVFSVDWDPPWYLFFLPSMNAGEVELQLTDKTKHKGREAVRILFKARSSGILAKLVRFEIDDEFVFLSEPATFCSLSVSKKIREGKRKRHIDVEYFRETEQLHFREMDESVVPSVLKREEIKDNIPECVRDPFSAIYYLRTLKLHEQHSQTSLIGDNDKIKEVRSHVEKKEDVQTPLGRFAAWKVNTIAVIGGLFKEGGEFRFWLSDDDRKLPVQFEAKMHLGRALGKLILLENHP